MPMRINSKYIFEEVRAVHGFTKAELLKKARFAVLTEARATVMYLLYHTANNSYLGVGKIMKRDHSTIIYGVRSISKKISENKRFGYKIAGMQCRILNKVEKERL